MSKFINKIGETYITNEGYNVTIIENLKANVRILFEDNHTQVCSYSDLKSGSVKNLNHRSVYKLGYIGIGRYKDYQPKKLLKQTWYDMFDRCYSGKHTTYKDCRVHPDWHSIQNFLEWYDKNYVEGFQLDKDLLVPGNKVYGPDTCCFIPQEINNLFKKNSKLGITRTKHILELTEKWKGSLSKIVYKKLKNYK